MLSSRTIFASLIAIWLSAPGARAEKTYSIGTENEADYRAAEILAAPHPEIPSEMHDHCFKSCCIAKFIIDPQGKATVKLISSCGDEQLDQAALKALKQWKFRPATLNGEPVESTRRVKIEFEVE